MEIYYKKNYYGIDNDAFFIIAKEFKVSFIVEPNGTSNFVYFYDTITSTLHEFTKIPLFEFYAILSNNDITKIIETFQKSFEKKLLACKNVRVNENSFYDYLGELFKKYLKMYKEFVLWFSKLFAMEEKMNFYKEDGHSFYFTINKKDVARIVMEIDEKEKNVHLNYYIENDHNDIFSKPISVIEFVLCNELVDIADFSITSFVLKEDKELILEEYYKIFYNSSLATEKL